MIFWSPCYSSKLNYHDRCFAEFTSIYTVNECSRHGINKCFVGINNDTADPPGGHIERDNDSNEITGLLFENVLDTVNAVIIPTIDEWMQYIEQALHVCLRYGATSVHACELNTWEAFCRLADEGRLPMRVFYSAYFQHGENLPKPGETHGPLLSCDRVKLFADGALGVATAAMSQPYLKPLPDGKCNHGMLLLSQVRPM
jgi:predicted amidohydrolase YtcJ